MNMHEFTTTLLLLPAVSPEVTPSAVSPLPELNRNRNSSPAAPPAGSPATSPAVRSSPQLTTSPPSAVNH